MRVARKTYTPDEIVGKLLTEYGYVSREVGGYFLLSFIIKFWEENVGCISIAKIEAIFKYGLVSRATYHIAHRVAHLVENISLLYIYRKKLITEADWEKLRELVVIMNKPLAYGELLYISRLIANKQDPYSVQLFRKFINDTPSISGEHKVYVSMNLPVDESIEIIL